MKITVNDAEREVEFAITAGDLLERLGYDKSFVAIAVNGECVSRADQGRFVITANDEIDVVSPQQGG